MKTARKGIEMKAKWIILVSICWNLCACAGPQPGIIKEELFKEVVSAMPEYQDFLTVDELHGALKNLQQK